MVGFEADRPARQLAQPLGDSGQEVALDDLDVDPFDGARRLCVAPIRHEHDLLVLHEHECVRALEPRQVADVDRVGDEERCDFEPLQLGAETLDALVQDLTFPLCARNTRASWYPVGPLPITRCETTSSITDTRRQSSRFVMSERCTSTTETLKSSSASRIA